MQTAGAPKGNRLRRYESWENQKFYGEATSNPIVGAPTLGEARDCFQNGLGRLGELASAPGTLSHALGLKILHPPAAEPGWPLVLKQDKLEGETICGP